VWIKAPSTGIPVKMFAVTKIFGFVWTRPKSKLYWIAQVMDDQYGSSSTTNIRYYQPSSELSGSVAAGNPKYFHIIINVALRRVIKSSQL